MRKVSRLKHLFGSAFRFSNDFLLSEAFQKDTVPISSQILKEVDLHFESLAARENALVSSVKKEKDIQKLTRILGSIQPFEVNQRGVQEAIQEVLKEVFRSFQLGNQSSFQSFTAVLAQVMKLGTYSTKAQTVFEFQIFKEIWRESDYSQKTAILLAMANSNFKFLEKSIEKEVLKQAQMLLEEPKNCLFGTKDGLQMTIYFRNKSKETSQLLLALTFKQAPSNHLLDLIQFFNSQFKGSQNKSQIEEWLKTPSVIRKLKTELREAEFSEKLALEMILLNYNSKIFEKTIVSKFQEKLEQLEQKKGKEEIRKTLEVLFQNRVAGVSRMLFDLLSRKGKKQMGVLREVWFEFIPKSIESALNTLEVALHKPTAPLPNEFEASIKDILMKEPKTKDLILFMKRLAVLAKEDAPISPKKSHPAKMKSWIHEAISGIASKISEEHLSPREQELLLKLDVGFGSFLRSCGAWSVHFPKHDSGVENSRIIIWKTELMIQNPHKNNPKMAYEGIKKIIWTKKECQELDRETFFCLIGLVSISIKQEVNNAFEFLRRLKRAAKERKNETKELQEEETPQEVFELGQEASEKHDYLGRFWSDCLEPRVFVMIREDAFAFGQLFKLFQLVSFLTIGNPEVFSKRLKMIEEGLFKKLASRDSAANDENKRGLILLVYSTFQMGSRSFRSLLKGESPDSKTKEKWVNVQRAHRKLSRVKERKPKSYSLPLKS